MFNLEISDTTVGIGAMTLKKNEERERKNGPDIVAVCCTQLHQLIVREKKKMKKKHFNKVQKENR